MCVVFSWVVHFLTSRIEFFYIVLQLARRAHSYALSAHERETVFSLELWFTDGQKKPREM